ncbi:MlaE family ABC transporter permease [Sunxiuqinia elliptica]|uniref:Phospholipid/cholesterol/gamma-HCH transport system permease protein n=1 Tax=Sunxiuqinia elliptica TaxID=655355 RepID=A0A4R6H7E5_9BACT|nr:ABC transporter permease [Sunxiuqinia elliptica]TDO03738.1 phospholipid/cholesterol/gamma-HCH transport system permease protein [Sunxiuqinia elliptica]TDO62019.1 phospholipid/cholesterol/gamma-HCH transport system permease protein [Sunxiuqinia elliptica]
MKFFFHVGRYFTLLARAFSRPEKHRIYFRKLFVEIEQLGLDSVGIVAIISVFMGGIITLQVAYNMSSPLFPSYLIGLGNRDTLILEFSSTIMGLIMAGKIGSNITSEIGSMRVTEQIDSLEIMGINSASYLILPKTLAVVFIFPFLFVLSVFFGLIGGLIVGPAVGAVTAPDYINGIQYLFNPYYVTFSMIKTLFFGFLVATIPAYFGYFVEGGAFEVGTASTKAVVNTNILILVFDLILTQLLF